MNDIDLDALEKSVAKTRGVSWNVRSDSEEAIVGVFDAVHALPALIARVRAAEAEREGSRYRAGVLAGWARAAEEKLHSAQDRAAGYEVELVRANLALRAAEADRDALRARVERLEAVVHRYAFVGEDCRSCAGYDVHHEECPVGAALEDK